jgi:protein PsiE
MFTHIDRIGEFLVSIFHRLALFGIGAATAWSACLYMLEIAAAKDRASIQDLLLLFVYLELGAMVGIYFRTNRMPVRFLIYIAITALTRHMVDLVTDVASHIEEIAVIGGTTLILAASLYTIRKASHDFPSRPRESEID